MKNRNTGVMVGRNVSKLPSGLEDPEDFWKSIIVPKKKEKEDVYYYDIDDDDDDNDDDIIDLDNNDISFQSSHLFRKDDDDDYIPFEPSNNHSSNSNIVDSTVNHDFDRFELKTPPPKRAKGRRKPKQPQRFMYETVSTPTHTPDQSKGLRRSKRKRTAPLAFWKNEKPHYAISPNTGTRVRIGSFTRESPK